MIRVGCCGFPVSRKRYVEELSVVELQNTFYDLPSREWCRSLRGSLPSGFEITVKAWQVVTHPSTSPTWRKMKSKLKGDPANYGFLKHTRENVEAFMEVVDRARILGARIIVLQTPPSMPCTPLSLESAEGFLKEVLGNIGEGIMIGWEPRGECSERKEVVELLGKYGLIHVVDPFKRKPASTPNGVAYLRLHGRGAGETNYRYKYSDSDLEELYAIIEGIGSSETYVLFNNVYMFDDAVRFKRLLASRGVKVA
ncbi:DUF72 domain-containing protein [Desulfurococcus mucosus]|uniref:DUF72 domain-containing protein n=1 Tax=Desulfurococcus mucosus (strain ATCC 35584 / DSM 2162 / JCM 9187 / O7/1) TaxID=765177 RepID=E8R751_DESM0|nr:DUF72 domain-containing protein [Desulfurococcus mucosus]ADV65516.1 protein of unknown function DUF72 [Desulfurococcus mucosus DSM 2162]